MTHLFNLMDIDSVLEAIDESHGFSRVKLRCFPGVKSAVKVMRSIVKHCEAEDTSCIRVLQIRDSRPG